MTPDRLWVIERAYFLANGLRAEALSDEPNRTLMLDAADQLEHRADQLRTMIETREHLETIISNLRAKLHHLQMVDSGE